MSRRYPLAIGAALDYLGVDEEPAPGSLMEKGGEDVLFMGWNPGDDANVHDGYEHLGRAYEAFAVYCYPEAPTILYIAHPSRLALVDDEDW